MKKAEWFVYNCVNKTANQFEIAFFESIKETVTSYKAGTPEWQAVWKQSPEYTRAIIDYIRDPEWWPRINKLGASIIKTSQKNLEKKKNKPK
jgi:hypothetical protein